MNWLEFGKRVIDGNVTRMAVGLGLSVALLLVGPAALAALDLGPAADFAVFQMGTPEGGGGSWSTANIDFINGDVAFLAPSLGGNANVTITGNLFGTVTITAVVTKNWRIAGDFFPVPASTLIGYADQARAFSAAAASFTSLPNIGNITGGTYTFTAANRAEPGTYIVNATGINLNSNFILDGSGLPAGSRVIVNVADSYSLTSGPSIVLAGGLTPAEVLINYLGTSGVESGADVQGTLLAPNATGLSINNATIFGSLLIQNVNISNVRIGGIAFVPEPSTWIAGVLLLLPFGAGALRILRKAL